MRKSPTESPRLAGDLERMRRAPSHPGEVFREDYRIPAGISQAEASRRLGWTKNRMNEFEVGKRGVTIENALALAALTGTSAEFWVTLQVRRDLWFAMREQRPDIEPLA
jgi:addiction module HigA family antidote